MYVYILRLLRKLKVISEFSLSLVTLKAKLTGIEVNKETTSKDTIVSSSWIVHVLHYFYNIC